MEGVLITISDKDPRRPAHTEQNVGQRQRRYASQVAMRAWWPKWLCAVQMLFRAV